MLGADNKSDWQLLPYVAQLANGTAPGRVLLHAFYLGTASGFQPAGSDVRLEGATLELLVPGITVKEMAIFSPAGPEARPRANSFANGDAGARLMLRDPAVYLVVELTVAGHLPYKSDDQDLPPLEAPTHLKWMSAYDFVPPQQQGWLNLGMNVVHAWPNASVGQTGTKLAAWQQLEITSF
eukprot:SAG11_NODE_333_length_10574_cov_7.889451_9_plen_181_part_00